MNAGPETGTQCIRRNSPIQSVSSNTGNFSTISFIIFKDKIFNPKMKKKMKKVWSKIDNFANFRV